MIKTVHVDTMEGVLDLIAEQEYYESLKRYRNPYLYRGMADGDYNLVTSISRNCKDQQKKLESIILKSFTKYAVFNDPAIDNSIWRQMIVGQHHGLPTRLLDWSHSPLVGLHFATVEHDNMDNMDKHDCIVWRIDMKELHSALPEKYLAQLNDNNTFVMSVDMLNKVTTSLEEYDEDMDGENMVIIEPPSVEQRIINQYSYFSIVPMGMTSVEEFLDNKTENTIKYIISKDLRWRIRDMLDQLNINERMMYPGLDGLSEWLARHYYVKD